MPPLARSDSPLPRSPCTCSFSDEPAAAKFLREQGYGDLGTIVRTHRAKKWEHAELPSKIEQNLLAYADKRVDLEHVVTLDQRFTGLIERHKKDATSPEEVAWQKSIRALESELFPLGPPL